MLPVVETYFGTANYVPFHQDQPIRIPKIQYLLSTKIFDLRFLDPTPTRAPTCLVIYCCVPLVSAAPRTSSHYLTTFPHDHCVLGRQNMAAEIIFVPRWGNRSPVRK